MKKKVLLLTAPRPEPRYSPVHSGDNRPPQGLGCLSAYIEKYGHETVIVDLYAFGGTEAENNPSVRQEEIGQQLNIDLEAYIKEFIPDYIGMYVHTMSFEPASYLSRRLKADHPDIIQICGGPHPTLLPESMPTSFDYVVAGEGEIALLDIIEGRIDERIVYGVPMRSEDLEKLPWVNLDHFWNKPYNWELKLFNRNLSPVVTTSTSRGCPFRCRFCGVKALYPRYTTVSAQRVFDRMCELSSRYDVSAFYFREDNFTANLKRLETFCDLLINSGEDFKWVCESRVRELTPTLINKIARSGCIGLYIGCESGSSKVLEYMQKDESPEDFLEKFPILHQHGIATYTTWVYGTPGENQSDRQITDELIQILNPTSVDRFVYIGIPGSAFYEQIIEKKEYEFIDQNGFMYPNGYLSLATALYGHDDPRVQYVRRIYAENRVIPVQISY